MTDPTARFQAAAEALWPGRQVVATVRDYEAVDGARLLAWEVTLEDSCERFTCYLPIAATARPGKVAAWIKDAMREHGR